MNNAYETTELEVQGLNFNIEIHADDTSGPPWEECESYGPVREGRFKYDDYVHKTPGERVLFDGGRHGKSYLYDWAGAMRLAVKDGWGPQDPALTPRQNVEAVVKADFDFLKAWCDGEWIWVGVCVSITLDGVEYTDSLWGIEYWQGYNLTDPKNAYLLEVAKDMCETIAAAHSKEKAERAYWEARDVVTR